MAVTLGERIRRGAERAGGRGVRFVVGGADEHVSWHDLLAEASSFASGLAALGVGPGTHVGVLGPTTRAHVVAIEAVWLCGATLVVLPLPMRLGSIDEFVAQTRTRLHDGDVSLVLIDPDLAPFLVPEPGDPTVVSYHDVPAGRGPVDVERPEPDALAALQFTSGSTSEPKGVMLTHRTLGANLDAITGAAALGPDDVMVSWLPLYHDMGLVGFLLTPMTTGTELVLGAPTDFLGAPARWMRWMSAHGGTVTAGPNFSWVLAARALRSEPEPLDLGRVRIALNGAEPVDPATVHDLVAAGERHGLRPGAVYPAFGMAELMIGGAFPVPLSGLAVDTVDRDELESGRRAVPVPADAPESAVRRLARLGRPVPGLELRIVDEAGAPLPERHVGELHIRGTSVTPGYYRRPDATAAAFDGDWLRTGDLAYLAGGELVVCGRSKDVIIVGGRNVHPQDVERAVGDVDGVRAGNVIAFGVPGRRAKESVVVVAEARTGDPALVAKLVAERVIEAIGVPARDVVLVPAGTIPKTSSGKLQRAECRRRYLDGAYGEAGG